MQLMKNAGTHKRNYVNGKVCMRMDNQYIEESKAKHKEPDGGITNWFGKRDAKDAMDRVIPVITRIRD